MIELNLENKKGKIKINSSDVKNILRLRPDFEYIQDISETINQENIMVYDCQLSRDLFNMEDIDVCNIFTNLLDNSIEAAKKNENKNIKLYIETVGLQSVRFFELLVQKIVICTFLIVLRWFSSCYLLWLKF